MESIRSMTQYLIGGVVTVIVAIITYFSTRKRNNASATKDGAEVFKILAESTNILLAPLNTRLQVLEVEVGSLKETVSKLNQEINSLRRENDILRLENAQLIGRVNILEQQIFALGHTPISQIAVSLDEDVTIPIYED
jgi:FtsZ-binding cell division protein ZapB